VRVPVPPGSAPDRNVVVADPRIRRFISARYSDLNTEAGEIEKYDLFVSWIPNQSAVRRQRMP